MWVYLCYIQEESITYLNNRLTKIVQFLCSARSKAICLKVIDIYLRFSILKIKIKCSWKKFETHLPYAAFKIIRTYVFKFNQHLPSYFPFLQLKIIEVAEKIVYQWFPYSAIRRWISSNKKAKSGRAIPVCKCHLEWGSQASHQSCPGQKSLPSWKSGLLCSNVVRLVASWLTNGSKAAPTLLMFGWRKISFLNACS